MPILAAIAWSVSCSVSANGIEDAHGTAGADGGEAASTDANAETDTGGATDVDADSDGSAEPDTGGTADVDAGSDGSAEPDTGGTADVDAGLDRPPGCITAPRDCASPVDNDCDGKPDDTVDSACNCSVGATRPCDAHPDHDGRGPCRAGTQACVSSAGGTSSDWTACTGSVGPAATNVCIFGNDDMCTGVPVGDPASTQCQCGAFTMPNPASTGLPNPTSYTTNEDGSITDNVTGLVWEGTVSAGTYRPADATAYCASKAPAGAWRLPTRLELVSLVDYTVAYPDPGPRINAVFTDTPALPFWTSTMYRGPSGFYGPKLDVWAVTFRDGQASPGSSTYAYPARCVRTVPAPKCYTTRFQVQPGGLVLDAATGLTWRQDVDLAKYTFDDAQLQCLRFGDGWRLPSFSEVQTIVDDSKAEFPALDTSIFPGWSGDTMWTSSRAGEVAGYYFGRGGCCGSDLITTSRQAGCVR
jgi:hypothetical protein